MDLYLRNITQTYIQSTTSLNSYLYIQLPPEFGLQNGSIMKVIKSLYGVPKADAYWFNTYHTHYINKLFIIESTYNFCLLYTDGSSKGFEVVDLQINNILILAGNIFAAAKEKELKKARLLAKNTKKVTHNTAIKFNGVYIRLTNNNSLFSVKESSGTAYI